MTRSLVDKRCMTEMARSGARLKEIGEHFGISHVAAYLHIKRYQRLEAMPDGMGFLGLYAQRVLHKLGIKSRAEALEMSRTGLLIQKADCSLKVLREIHAWMDAAPEKKAPLLPDTELRTRTKDILCRAGIETREQAIAVLDQIRYIKRLGWGSLREIERWLGLPLPVEHEAWDGFPENPEKVGYHYICHFPALWNSLDQVWLTHYPDALVITPKEISETPGKYRYRGPVPKAPEVYRKKWGPGK